jgi:hypothetical protein
MSVSRCAIREDHRRDPMERYLRYNAEYELAICVACESGLPSTGVLRHMSEEHKETWRAHRKELKTYVDGLTLVPPHELEFPTGVCEVVEGIASKDGWICGWQGCMVAGANRDWVVKHCVKAHGKEAAKEKKAYEGRVQSLLWHPYIKFDPRCVVQRLTARYFPVTEQESTVGRKSRQESAFEKAVVTFKQKEMESLNTAHRAIGDNKLSVRTPWLGATKWLERFAVANMNTLSEMAANAEGKGDYLSMVEKEMGDLMNECHAGLRDLKSREWDRILFWLKSTKEAVIHSKPLSVYIQQKTVQTYSAYWQRFTCFCLRAIDDPSCQPGGVNHGFNWTAEQQELLMSLKSCYEFVDGSPQGPGIRRS